ncbi:GNAT family N-acetyltransferase [Brachybacterium hainanense]|uniref:Enhanced intracellular survival protein Eis n=1 Tax=Brachybacterium hainanense TaxID=1541174 RepID=A0ABV6RA82_9MICO
MTDPAPVRELGPADRPAVDRMISLAFGGRSPRTEPEPFPAGVTALGIDGPEGDLAASLLLREDAIALGAGSVRCGGIAGLSVHPGHRGQGHFGALLREALARSTARGDAFSMLYPSHQGIYRRLGYQTVAQVRRYVLPLADLQGIRTDPSLRISPVLAADMPALRALYLAMAHRENALLLREGPLFGDDGLPAAPWNAVIVRDGTSAPRGYLSYARTADGVGGTGLEVFDLVGEDRAALEALLSWLGSWSTVVSSALVRTRTEDPLLDVLPGAGLRPDPRTVPLVMMRLLDTAAALEARTAPPGLEGEVHLEVEDAAVPEGVCRAAGVRAVRVRSGRVEVLPAGSSPLPRTRLDVHAAALLLAGGRTLAEARRLGLRADADPAAEAFLDTLLAGPRPSVLDFF